MSNANPEQMQTHARQVLSIEAEAVLAQQALIAEPAFVQACEAILNTRGHVIVSGLGKSGHIGAKIAATLASTGTPAFFVHPTEAGHGDMGMLTAADTLIAISFSGESGELMTMIPLAQAMGLSVIAITGRTQSAMAQAADIHLHLRVEKEACPLGLAPTSSSTATLALCDALAVAIMQARDFSSADFARSHPFGRLGRRLITKIGDVMRKGAELPLNRAEDSVQTALFQITDKRLGLTLICDEAQQLLGIYTDGDLRRSLGKYPDALSLPLSEVMTHAPLTTHAAELAAQALILMQNCHITALPVVENGKLCGVVHIHDLLQAGVA